MSFVSFFEAIWTDLFGTGADAARTRATIVKDVNVALGLVQTAVTAVEDQGLIGTADRAHIEAVLTGAREVATGLTNESSPSEIGNAIRLLQNVVGLLPDGSAKTAAGLAIGTAAALLPAVLQAVSAA